MKFQYTKFQIPISFYVHFPIVCLTGCEFAFFVGPNFSCQVLLVPYLFQFQESIARFLYVQLWTCAYLGFVFLCEIFNIFQYILMPLLENLSSNVYIPKFPFEVLLFQVSETFKIKKFFSLRIQNSVGKAIKLQAVFILQLSDYPH
jgi:hypothetical protein